MTRSFSTSSASISGIVDLIELGTSTAVFAFLPYCQLKRSNVVVDFVMSRTPSRAKTFCDAIGSLVYLAIALILTWRLVLGGFDMHRYNESFTTIGFPRWISFPYAAVCMAILIVVIAFTTSKELFPVRMAGTSTGLANIFPFAGGAVFQPVFGYILERHGRVKGAFALAGYEQGFLLLFICSIVAVLASLCMQETLAKE